LIDFDLIFGGSARPLDSHSRPCRIGVWRRLSLTRQTSMRLLDYFSRAYVINLPERTDRRVEMERTLARVGMWPSPGKLEFLGGIRPKDAGGFPSAGARGNFLSHLEVFRSAVHDGAERILVLEDDMDLRADFPSLEGGLVRSLATRPWGFVYFGFASD